MSETVQGNVLKFRDFDKAGRNISGAEALSIMHVCRDTLIQGVALVMSQKHADMQDSLLELADRATGLDARNAYYDAVEILNKHGQELAQGLRREITSTLDQASVPASRSSTKRNAEIGDVELSLLDDDTFEEALTLNKVSARLRFQCSEQLTALDKRVAILMSNPELKEDANPFGPRSLFDAFFQATEALHSSLQARLALLQEFDRQISPSLPSIYREMNRQLVDKGILPKITIGSVSRPVRPPDGFASAVSKTRESDDDTEFLTLFKKLFALGAGQYIAGSPAASPELVAGAPPPRVLQTLTHIQHGDLSALPELDAAKLAAGEVNVLHALRVSPAVAQVSQIDAMTIDIVAMLFDYFFDDAHIPDALKALIGRLQIPVLKVAMLDKHFFSNKKHPARQFLDVMASAAVGWSEKEEPRLYARIGDCVQIIIDRFEEDVGVFWEQLGVLVNFLEDEERQADSNTGQVMEDLERREREEIAAVIADDQIRRRTGLHPVPPLIEEFLDKLWRRALTDTYAHHGEQSEQWVKALESMDDLIWSISPKTGTDERLRLVALLPDLLRRLRGALGELGLSEADKDAFFSKLVFLHAQAVRAGLESVVSAADGAVTSSTAPGAESSLMAVEHQWPATVQVPRAAEPSSPPEPEFEVEDEFILSARRLDIGAWVEFAQPDGTFKTLKLSWVSRLKGIYLFTNRQGLDAVSLALPRLAARLEDGSARLIEGTQLTERAVDRLMSALQHRA